MLDNYMQTDSDAEIKFAEGGTVKYTIGHDAASDNFVIGTTNVDTQQRLVIDSGQAMLELERLIQINLFM
jgi:hypothetical protein